MARTHKVVEDRREQILDAAMRVFAQKGFIKATNKNIADEAGITPGLIYHYFDNKEAVLKAIIEERSPIQVIRSLPAHVLEMPLDSFLRFLVRQVLAVVEGEQFVQLIRVFLPEVVHNPEIGPLAVNMLHRVLDFIGDYFTAKAERGELRSADPALTAQVFVGSMMGFVLRRQVIRDPGALQLTHEQIADAIVDTVLKGLLPR